MGQGVETVASDLDKKLIELEEKVATVTKQIQDEREALGEVKEDDKLRQRVSVTVAADKECEVEFVLIYGLFSIFVFGRGEFHTELNVMQGFATRLGTLHMTYMSRWMKRINQWHLFIKVPFFKILAKYVACPLLRKILINVTLTYSHGMIFP